MTIAVLVGMTIKDKRDLIGRTCPVGQRAEDRESVPTLYRGRKAKKIERDRIRMMEYNKRREYHVIRLV